MVRGPSFALQKMRTPSLLERLIVLFPYLFRIPIEERQPDFRDWSNGNPGSAQRWRGRTITSGRPGQTLRYGFLRRHDTGLDDPTRVLRSSIV